jgi:hypothetical protein
MPKYDYKAKIMPAWLFGIPHKDNVILPEGVDYQKSWMATAMVRARPLTMLFPLIWPQECVRL